ncbi:MAG: MFS transporter, partial [Spirochaetales bacterium]|nr:MFS transporter [Spirochaetales bacterium]
MVLRFSINYFIFFAAMATVVPYLQQILKMHNFRAYEIGLLLGIFEITGIFGPLIIGWFADKIGKYRFILLILTIGSALSFMFLRTQLNFVTAAFVLILFGMMYRPIASLTDALASRTLPDVVKQYGSARIWGSIGFVGISFFYQFWGFLDTSSPVRIVSVFIVLMGVLFLSSLSLPKIHISRKQKHLPEEKVKLLEIIKSMPMPFWIGISAALIIKMGMSGYYSFFSIYLNDIYN